MGKAGRVACITIPMALTIASFVCLALVEVAGWNKNTLNSLHFFEANLENLTVASSGDDVVTTAIDSVLASSAVAKIYQVHLWNYCTANKTDGDIDQCSKRKSDFVFDPLTVWAVATLENNSEEYEDKILGESGRKALSAYRAVAKWMFIAYQVSFWTTLATIVVGILAIFSRWGSLITWALAFVSSFFTIAAVLTSTILFSVLVSALNKALKDYGIRLTLGHSALTTCWLAVAFSWGATLFWLFSVCCCSGRSNPHHKSNKGGLWNAEPKGQGYRGLTVEKTGGGGDYERVASPYVGGHHDDQVPLQNFAAQPAGHGHQQGAGYEPYRHA
ncbi:hypothetical protein DOTSEDRAFT_163502 [Dothistroma septosporum NZE10]|uniref:SUR7 protein n=1 Tax=Dothistroma septosporum (strain NZE10 / CBS 128990) TaxID=675120 RepID=N1Q3P1_DOTSN|nr:hypothetical protein DOTSEDRAFT_163502 [Dothistroma septosporum NZE10]